MPEANSEQARDNETLSDLVHNSRIRFGQLLWEICEVSGLSQGKLAQEAKYERQRLIDNGKLRSGDQVGSMEQPTISKVIAGIQEPTYFQVYIWLRVIEAHFKSPRLASICEDLHLPCPEFTPELARKLWYLSGFIPPDERAQVYEDAKEDKIVEHVKSYPSLKKYRSLLQHRERRWKKNSTVRAS